MNHNGKRLSVQLAFTCLLYLVTFASSISAQDVLEQSSEDRSTSLPCADHAVRLSSDQLTKLVAKRTPVEPPMMERLNIHGTVKVAVCVNRKGKAIALAVLDGHPMAQQSVIESVRKWVFTPYSKNGKAKMVEGVLDIAFDFRSPIPE